MKNVFSVLLLSVLMYACTHSSPDTFVLHGKLKGMSKATVYITKWRDSMYVVADSAKVSGTDEFELSDALDSPQIYYLKVKERPADSLLIFAEPGEVHLTAYLDKYAYSHRIKGSENQRLLEEYRRMSGKFNDKILEMTKLFWEYRRDNDSVHIDSLDKAYRSLVRKKYLYTANFAVKNAGQPVAAYVALTNLDDAGVALLDTVYRSLAAPVKKSLYAKELKRLLEAAQKE